MQDRTSNDRQTNTVAEQRSMTSRLTSGRKRQAAIAPRMRAGTVMLNLDAVRRKCLLTLLLWARRDSNPRRLSHLIYSQTRLSTSVHSRSGHTVGGRGAIGYRRDRRVR